MAIQIQSYDQRVATPSVGGTPQLRAVNQPVIDISGSIDKLANVYDKIEDDSAETEAMKAVARTRMDVEEAYRGAQEKVGPGADGFTPQFMGLYEGHVTKTADGLSSELARKKYSEKMLGFGVSLQDRSITWEADQRRTERKRSFTEAADNHASTLFSTDATDRESSFNLMRSEIEHSLESVDLLPDAKAELREKIKTKMSYAAVQGDLRDRPEAVQDWLIKGEGSPYYSKLRATESSNNGYYRSLAMAESGMAKREYEQPPKATGLVEAGTINLDKRKVLREGDVIKTEESMSVGVDSGEVLIPTVVEGKKLTEKEAIAHYRNTGEHLGIFKTVEDADKYAQALHERQGRMYGGGIPGQNIGSDTSSAFGPYQFTKGTWDSVIAKHPDLGLTEKNRFDPISQEVAIRAFTDDNAKVLKANGMPATNANLFMMHFLGEAGGVRFLKATEANPNDPASLHVDSAAVAANGGVFKNGRTVQDVYKLFALKFGMDDGIKQPAGSPSYYGDLNFQSRNTLYDQADAELRKRRSDGAAAFKQTVDNTIAQYAANGFSTEAIGEQQFVAAMGAPRGTVAYGDFVAATIGAKAQHDLKTLDINQHGQYLEGIRPDETDLNYAEKLKGFEQARSASSTIRNSIKEDAAGYVAGYNPSVQKQLAAIADVEGSDDTKRAAAVGTYRAQLNQEYDRLGVPYGMRRIIPKYYADALTTSLSRVPVDNAGATQVWKEFDRQRQAWGTEWQSVLRELGDGSGDIQVIGSGISEEAATILLVNRSKTLPELTKFLPEGSGVELTAQLQGDFADYAKTLRLPGENGEAFFAAAQKLTAIRMRDGTKAGRSAEWAYDQLIGSRFVFEGDARIPKDKASVIRDLDRAKDIALEKVDMSQLPAGVDAADAKSWYASSSRWVTAPDDSRLILMEGSRAVVDKQGRAITASWQEIQAMPPAKGMGLIDLLGIVGGVY